LQDTFIAHLALAFYALEQIPESSESHSISVFNNNNNISLILGYLLQLKIRSYIAELVFKFGKYDTNIRK